MLRLISCLCLAACMIMLSACPHPGYRVGKSQFYKLNWTGAVSDTSARVVARLQPVVSTVLKLELSTDRSFGKDVRQIGRANYASSPGGDLIHFDLKNLSPSTKYFYRFRANDSIDTARVSSFTTFPPSGSSSDFSFVFGSCQKTGSDGEVYDRMLRKNPLFILVTGDFHYDNISANNVERFFDAWEESLVTPRLSRFYGQVPIAYMWDDHDFGPNNSDSTSPARLAALNAYREMVPHYPLASAAHTSAVHQAFSVGRVRFILSDLRSARSPYKLDDPNKTNMGNEQKQWFFKEMLRSAQDHDLLVWVSSVPWIDDENSSDNWSYYRAERKEITDFIIKHNLQKRMCMLSGDAHMLAIDDGTNSFNSDAEGPGFPVMHAAALDRIGSLKGGPYSHGRYRGTGQYGKMDVRYVADGLEVEWSGFDKDHEKIVDYTFTVDPIKN